MNEQLFRHLVKLYAQLYVSVEMLDDAVSSRYVKGVVKKKLNIALQELERQCKPFVHKLYETDDILFQAIQERLKELTDEVLSKSLEEIVNGKHKEAQ